MIRKPQEKAAIQILKSAFAAEGVKLGHTKALHLLAQLEGHKSHKQAGAAALSERCPEQKVPTDESSRLVLPIQCDVVGAGGGWEQVFVDVAFEVEYPLDEGCRAMLEAGDLPALLSHVADDVFVDVEFQSESASTLPGYASCTIEKFIKVESDSPHYDELFNEIPGGIFRGTVRVLVSKDKNVDGAQALEVGGGLEGFVRTTLVPLNLNWLSARNVV